MGFRGRERAGGGPDRPGMVELRQAVSLTKLPLRSGHHPPSGQGPLPLCTWVGPAVFPRSPVQGERGAREDRRSLKFSPLEGNFVLSTSCS